MLSSYFWHKQALEAEQRGREDSQRHQEHQRRIEELIIEKERLAIQRLVAERQLHEAKQLRYEAEYKLLTLKAQRRRNRRRSRR